MPNGIRSQHLGGFKRAGETRPKKVERVIGVLPPDKWLDLNDTAKEDRSFDIYYNKQKRQKYIETVNIS
jgi:hypothetical protein